MKFGARDFVLWFKCRFRFRYDFHMCLHPIYVKFDICGSLCPDSIKHTDRCETTGTDYDWSMKFKKKINKDTQLRSSS